MKRMELALRKRRQKKREAPSLMDDIRLFRKRRSKRRTCCKFVTPYFKKIITVLGG